MKPFDLEAAKRGALFEHEVAPGARGKFIGFRANGSVVYEILDSSEIAWAPAEALRMLPRKVARWANVYHRPCGRTWLGQLCKSESEAAAVRSRKLDREWRGTTRVEWEE